MADCYTAIKKLTFDYNDPQVTTVTVINDFEGDCPFNIKRRYEKTFPARIPAVEIMTMDGGVKDYILW